MRIPTILTLLSIFTTFTFARSWNKDDECPSEIKTFITGDCCGAIFSGVAADCCHGGPDYPRCLDDVKFDTLKSVHAALSNCPNITKLDLRIAELSCNHATYVFSFPFDPLGGEKFANLTSVRLDGYEFSGLSFWDLEDRMEEKADWQWVNFTSTAPSVWGKLRELLHLRPDKTHLDLWMDAMDWTRVEDLTIIGDVWNSDTGELAAKLAPQLSSLKSLETEHPHFAAALPPNTLTSLKFVGATRPGTPDALRAILSAQGESLQSLEFRSPEAQRGPFIQDFDLTLLPNMTHSLTHLALNVPRNGTWPLENLSLIAQLPQLESLDVYMNIQSLCAQQRVEVDEGYLFDKYGNPWGGECSQEKKYQLPFVDEKGAEEMFRHMKKEKKGVALSNVTFYVGNWRAPPMQPSCTGEPWFTNRRAKVVCREEGNREDGGWCVVEEGEEYWKQG
jgi:hypothetical protein